jgi:hypothetical protein
MIPGMTRALGIFAFSVALSAQPAGYNYDESKVPKYTLPDPLVMADGTPVRDAEAWTEKRRPEIVKLFEREVYGSSPAALPSQSYELSSLDRAALGGKAVRKEVAVMFNGRADGKTMSLLIYLPTDANGPVPTFLALNFQGNHSINSDPGIALSKEWMRPRDDDSVVENRANEKARGIASSRWAIDKILERGYALATIYYGDIDPDYDDGFQNGVQPLFYKPGQTKPGPAEWGSIGAWAWGLSRAMDYFETDNSIDE